MPRGVPRKLTELRKLVRLTETEVKNRDREIEELEGSKQNLHARINSQEQIIKELRNQLVSQIRLNHHLTGIVHIYTQPKQTQSAEGEKINRS